MSAARSMAPGPSELEGLVDQLLSELDTARGSGNVFKAGSVLLSERVPPIRRLLAARIDRGLRLDPVLLDEAIDDALLRLERFAAAHDVDRSRAVRLLTTMTRRAALDRWRARERRARAEQTVEDVPERASATTTEEVVMGMLARQASIEAVLLGLRKAMQLGRPDLVALVRTWLDLADRMSGLPSQRQVAEELQISHTTVRRSLDEFARLLDDGDEVA